VVTTYRASGAHGDADAVGADLCNGGVTVSRSTLHTWMKSSGWIADWDTVLIGGRGSDPHVLKW